MSIAAPAEKVEKTELVHESDRKEEKCVGK
jgi:hypothetical protein